MATHPSPAADAATTDQFEVRLDEAKLYSHASPAAEYWAVRRQWWDLNGRLRVIESGFPGDRLALGPLTYEDAEFFVEHLVEKGAPKSVFKVRKVGAR